MRLVLLVEGGHAELLMDEGLVLPARRSVAVVSVIAEAAVVLVSQPRQHCVNSTQESFILLDHIELLATTSETGDCLAQVLGKHLQLPIRFLAANEDLANYINNLVIRPRPSLPFVLPLII